MPDSDNLGDRDERVSLAPLDAQAALRALLATGPHVEPGDQADEPETASIDEPDHDGDEINPR